MKYVILGNTESKTHLVIADALEAAGYDVMTKTVKNMRDTYQDLGLVGSITDTKEPVGITYLNGEAFDDTKKYDAAFWKEWIDKHDGEVKDVVRTAIESVEAAKNQSACAFM